MSTVHDWWLTKQARKTNRRWRGGNEQQRRYWLEARALRRACGGTFGNLRGTDAYMNHAFGTRGAS